MEPSPSGDGIYTEILLADASGNITWNAVDNNNALNDVISYVNLAAFPLTGDQGKIFIDLSTNFMYIWKSGAYSLVCSNVSNATGTLHATRGGTGLVSFNIGDLIYADSTISHARLAVGSNNRCLVSNGTIPSWSLINLTSMVSNILPIANGGSVVSCVQGDLIFGSGTNVIGRIADVAIGNVLLSGGASLDPLYGKVGSSHVDSSILISGSNSIASGQQTILLNQTSTGSTDFVRLTLQGNKNVQMYLVADQDNVGENFDNSPVLLLSQDNMITTSIVALSGQDGAFNNGTAISCALPNIENCLVLCQRSTTNQGVFLGCSNIIQMAIYTNSISTTVPLNLPINSTKDACSIGFQNNNSNSGLYFNQTNFITGLSSAGKRIAEFSGSGAADGVWLYRRLVMSDSNILMNKNAISLDTAGSNCMMGRIQLNAGSADVYSSKYGATGHIFLTYHGLNSNATYPSGVLTSRLHNNGNSFRIQSSSSGDDCFVNWVILNSQ